MNWFERVFSADGFMGAANGPTHENREIAELPFRKRV